MAGGNKGFENAMVPFGGTMGHMTQPRTLINNFSEDQSSACSVVQVGPVSLASSSSIFLSRSLAVALSFSTIAVSRAFSRCSGSMVLSSGSGGLQCQWLVGLAGFVCLAGGGAKEEVRLGFPLLLQSIGLVEQLAIPGCRGTARSRVWRPSRPSPLPCWK